MSVVHGRGDDVFGDGGADPRDPVRDAQRQ